MFGAATRSIDSALYHYLLDLEIRRAIRYSHFFSICHVGLDQLHDGDGSVASTVAEILCETVRETDVIGLLNEQTVSVLLHNTEIQNAFQVAQRFRTRVADQTFSSGNVQVRLTASVGGVCFPTHGNNAATLLLRAGEMLATAKLHGGNQVAVPLE